MTIPWPQSVPGFAFANDTSLKQHTKPPALRLRHVLGPADGQPDHGFGVVAFNVAFKGLRSESSLGPQG